MSNTITIKDPNGNIVCSVENMDPIKSEEGFVDVAFKGLASGLKAIVASVTGFYALILIAALIAAGVSGAKAKIDANYAKKILKKLDPNYVNGLKKELKQIIEDENRMISEITDEIKSYAMKNEDIKANCTGVTFQYVTINHDGKIDEKEANKYLNKRIIDLVSTVKKPKEINYNGDLIELYFNGVSDDWWDETEDAIFDLKEYLKTFANNKKYSNKYIDHVNVSYDERDMEQDIFWFSFYITFVPNKEEMDKLLKPIVDAINS